jgi:hypothetical protein
MAAIVTSVSRSKEHTFAKPIDTTLSLVAGLGVRGDAHMGEAVKLCLSQNQFRAYWWCRPPRTGRQLMCPTD